MPPAPSGRWLIVATAAALLAACAPAPAPHGVPAAPAAHPGTQTTLSLQDAMRLGRDLGPIPGSTSLSLMLDLAGRNAAQLQSIIDAGGHVSPAELASRYGPDAGAVARVEAALRGAGLRPSWTPGTATLTVTGTAGAAQSFFHAQVHDFVAPDGARFHAPLAPVAVPAALSPTVTAVLGLNSYRAVRYSTLQHAGGLTPADIASIYDIAPLTQAGLTGSGVTVVFPESSIPVQSALDDYAGQFGLPPMQVTVKTNPDWGPALEQGQDGFSSSDPELAMDLEIVHAIAPGAKLVVYAGASGGSEQLPVMYQAMARENPNTIVSSSLGLNDCEGPQYQNTEVGFDTAWKTMAASGTTAYDASGDYGAFCRPGTLGVYPDVASANVTTCGATTIFQASNGGYGSEAAWGDPVDQIGTGGGVSSVWPQPVWQTGAGVQSRRSNGHRQVPDIAAPGDPISPYATIAASGPSPGDGTSAAAPFWAGITALIYQDLDKKHIKRPSLMAPLLYSFASQPSGIPNNPFHDVVGGSNLNDLAGLGWDFATGWGTPDVARLADDIEWYQSSHGGGG